MRGQGQGQRQEGQAFARSSALHLGGDCCSACSKQQEEGAEGEGAGEGAGREGAGRAGLRKKFRTASCRCAPTPIIFPLPLTACNEHKSITFQLCLHPTFSMSQDYRARMELCALMRHTPRSHIQPAIDTSTSHLNSPASLVLPVSGLPRTHGGVCSDAHCLQRCTCVSFQERHQQDRCTQLLRSVPGAVRTVNGAFYWLS